MESTKNMKKTKEQPTNKNTLKKTGTKIYERAERGRKEAPGTTALRYCYC